MGPDEMHPLRELADVVANNSP